MWCDLQIMKVYGSDCATTDKVINYFRYYGTWVLNENEPYPNILKLYLLSNQFTFFEKDGWPTIKINTWMGEGLLLLERLSENQARVAGPGEIVSLNDATVNYIGHCFKKAR